MSFFDERSNILIRQPPQKEGHARVFSTSQLLTVLLTAIAGISLVIDGIFFGYYPAQKTSRLDPIEALRYE